MKKVETKKLSPYVTLEQALAFDVQKPETKTASPIIDAVMEGLERIPDKNLTVLARFLEVNAEFLKGAVFITMGMSLSALRDQWLLARFLKLKSEKSKLSADEMARAVGFKEHSALWKFLKRMGREDLIKQRDNSYWHREFKPFSLYD